MLPGPRQTTGEKGLFRAQLSLHREMSGGHGDKEGQWQSKEDNDGCNLMSKLKVSIIFVTVQWPPGFS